MKQHTLSPLPVSVTATIDIPGSKSYTNRALIMAALTPNPVIVKNPLFSDDTEAMITCLQTLGIATEKSTDTITVSGHISDVTDGQYELDANLSGTTIRFILALACLTKGTKTIKGKGRLNERPIAELVNGLRQMGAEIEYINKDGYPPLRVNPSETPLKQNIVQMNGDISSQYFTALMMIAPLIGEVTIDVIGNQISKPYIDMTIDMMKQWGVSVMNKNYRRYTIWNNQTYEMNEYNVEGDYSAAGYFFAIAALTESTITLNNLNPTSKQGDKEFMDIMERMGSDISYIDNGITITGRGVTPIHINMEPCPDQAQTLAVLAAFAQGTTTMTGVRSLRIKETERVQAVQNELAKMDIKTESLDEDTLIIHGGNPKPAAIDTYNDHRMAMSFAIAGAKIEGMKINDPDVVNKTFPEFWEKMKYIGVEI
jgi:3-phosphoshikimate 1-carboxyvinyltransferase